LKPRTPTKTCAKALQAATASVLVLVGYLLAKFAGRNDAAREIEMLFEQAPRSLRGNTHGDQFAACHPPASSSVYAKVREAC
jgi:hypothetical protein